MPIAQFAPDLPMDQRMLDAEAEPIGPLWIRRQVFEHSVAVPLLTSSTASQIDFPRLTTQLLSASITSDPQIPPAVTYDDWVAAAGLHARLDSSEDAGVIIEALETNAPDAFVRCNDPEKLAPGRQLNYRHLLIPVPELLAFLKLHAAATISSRFRETVDTVWPVPENSVALSPTPTTLSQPAFPASPGVSRHSNSQPAIAANSPNSTPILSSSQSPTSPRIQHVLQHNSSASRFNTASSNINNSSPQGSPVLGVQPSATVTGNTVQSTAPPSPGMDGLVRKKTPTHLGAMVNTHSAIIASVQHAFQRETNLVVSNLKGLLLTIVGAYRVGQDPDDGANEISHNESGILMGSGSTAVESGTLSRSNSNSKVRRVNSTGSNVESSMADDHVKLSSQNMPVTRQMFEHLSFLLTTTCGPSGTYRPVSVVVPQWRDWSSTATVPLGELAETLAASLTRACQLRELDGSTDVAEIRDLDKKTILRSSLPSIHTGETEYPHGTEIRISNCSDCHFYLMASLGRVSFIACRDCTLFVGSCVSVSLINCTNVQVHAIARVCRVTNCFDTYLYLCTNRYPQIVGENRGLVFAPYNAAFSKLEAEKYLAAVGVDPLSNVWDKFYRPVHRSTLSLNRSDPDLTAAVATTLQPEQFLPFAVPIRQNASSSSESIEDKDDTNPENDEEEDRDAISKALFSVPLPLPQAYADQLLKKSQEISTIRRNLRTLEKSHASSSDSGEKRETNTPDVSMSDGAGSGPSKSEIDDSSNGSIMLGKRGVVQSLVQDRFREWLNTSGKIKQITELVKLDQEA